jgi:glucosylceramidase
MKQTSLLSIFITLAACTQPKQAEWTVTTPEEGFVQQQPVVATPITPETIADITIVTDSKQQQIDGFGGCFNELGWLTISALNDKDRDAVMQDLFSPEGMNFTRCRMPVAANDFARDWYSYNENDGDFAMQKFSVDNDKSTLIPFIKAAQKVNPALRIWASPWSPPTWMKYNHNYACKPNPEVNDLPGDPSQNLEGTNMFIQEPEYFKAYALYFRKFIEAYRKEGIDIEMIAPQNEFNSCQPFPSCTWTAEGLSRFIGDYLGPEMQSLGVKLMFGTMERADNRMVDTVMQAKSGQYISEISFQWAGKYAIEKVHNTYPNMKLIQSESECGNGRNSWDFCFYIWDQMKHYFKHGATAYMYWNISLDMEAKNRWKWTQNSLISVDPQAKTCRYNPEYFLMKHISHFVLPGAYKLETSGNDNVLAFLNPDGNTVILTANPDKEPKNLTVKVEQSLFTFTLKPKSINTFQIPAK